jgi:hypothetical protein
MPTKGVNSGWVAGEGSDGQACEPGLKPAQNSFQREEKMANVSVSILSLIPNDPVWVPSRYDADPERGGWVPDDELADIAAALGSPLRQVTAHY